MRVLVLAITLVAASAHAETDFAGMLAAAERGDSMARVVIGYSFYFGEYRDGTPVERDVNKAYAWASLANYQGNPEAQRLLNLVIPKLSDREAADALAGEYFKRYGAKRPQPDE
jgi:TPR repeat protein